MRRRLSKGIPNPGLSGAGRWIVAALVAGTMAAIPAGAQEVAADAEISAARALFETNLDAIRRHDREAYLACYLRSESLVRNAPDGLELGFEEHAAQSSDDTWPDAFDALDLRLVPVRPGVVYGTYRYRVLYGEDERSGISERLFVETPDGWRIAMTSAFESPPGTPPPPRALVGGTLVDGTGSAPVADGVIVLRGGRIECAGRRDTCPVPDGVEVVDLAGEWITPGLVDAHVHLSQTGWADGRPDAMDVRDLYPYEQVQAELRSHPEAWFRSYLCSGVTAVFDVGGYPWTWELMEQAENDTRAPHVVAAGPLLSTLDFWLNLPAERQFIYLDDETTAREAVQYLAAHDSAAVKVWFIPVADRDFDEMAAAVAAAGQEARDWGLPLIVHATGLREAKAALRSGAHMLVHSVWDRPVDDEFISLALRHRTVYCPTLTALDGYRRLFDAVASGRPPEVDDPNGCVGPETRSRLARTARLGADRVDPEQHDRLTTQAAEWRRIMTSNLERIHSAGIPVVLGTDAGNPLTLHGPAVYAEMEAMQAAGIPAMEVLVAATRGGAHALGRLEDLGTVEPGKVADLLVVAADPTAEIANLRRLRYVIRGGEIRPIEELRSREPD